MIPDPDQQTKIRRENTTPTERAEMLIRLAKGLSYSEIANEFGRSKGTIHNVIKRWENDNSLQERPRSGRPNVLSDRDKRALLNDVRSNPAIHIRELSTKFNVSHETIRTTLKSHGFYYSCPDMQMEISPKNQIERVKFAEAHIHWFLDEWSHIVFTDESTFQNLPCFRGLWMENDKPKIEIKIEKRALSVGVWGAITINGPGPLILIKDTMNGDQHKKIIEEHMVGLVGEHYTLQQDNATYHSQSKKYLQEMGRSVLDWPPQSADINPIENIWGYMKGKISGKAGDKSELFQEIQSIWEEIPWEIIFNCYQSMPYRMLDILHRKGDCIDY